MDKQELPKELPLIDENEMLYVSLVDDNLSFKKTKKVIREAAVHQRDKDQLELEDALKQLEEAREYDLRQYIPDGKYRKKCPCFGYTENTYTYDSEPYCGLLDKILRRENVYQGASMKDLNCPKPPKKAEDGN